MSVDATSSDRTLSRSGESRGAGGHAFGRVLATRRARRGGPFEEETRDPRLATNQIGLEPRASFAVPETADATPSGVDVAARAERVAVLAVERARDGIALRVETTIALRDGELVEIAVRATARDVEIRVVAPAAAAAAIDAGRPRLVERLAARGVRVRTCDVSVRRDESGTAGVSPAGPRIQPHAGETPAVPDRTSPGSVPSRYGRER